MTEKQQSLWVVIVATFSIVVTVFILGILPTVMGNIGWEWIALRIFLAALVAIALLLACTILNQRKEAILVFVIGVAGIFALVWTGYRVDPDKYYVLVKSGDEWVEREESSRWNFSGSVRQVPRIIKNNHMVCRAMTPHGGVSVNVSGGKVKWFTPLHVAQEESFDTAVWRQRLEAELEGYLIRQRWETLYLQKGIGIIVKVELPSSGPIGEPWAKKDTVISVVVGTDPAMKARLQTLTIAQVREQPYVSQ